MNALTTPSSFLSRTLAQNIISETALLPNVWEAIAESGEVDRAILNLAVNARDAIPEDGKLSIATRNLILSDEDVKFEPDTAVRDFIQLAVSDTGIGMTSDLIEKAITPFFTTKEAGSCA
jgi:signal transduction histidine kinase